MPDKKTAVVAISTGCLDYMDIQSENLFILRCKIIMGDETFSDYVEIDANDFYDRLKNEPDLVPTSSMPAIGEIDETLHAIEDAGYESAIVVTISSELSGTFQTCKMAKNAYEGNLDIHVVDSKNAAASEGFLTIEALRLVNEGTSVKTIIPYLERLAIARRQYFMVDNLRLLVKNGRLSGFSGMMGRLLKIKPILQVNDEGKIVPFEKVRTHNKALKRMIDQILSDLENVENFVVTYDTSDNKEGFKTVFNAIEEKYPDHVHYAAPITPVIGAHTGSGTVGVAYFDLDKAKSPQ
ncbi:MAG: DegV family protein [Bacillota bacterium]